MSINLNSDNQKLIEQEVHGLILRKLYIKVDNDKVFIDKQDFVKLILLDVIALAKSEGEINKSLQLSLKMKPEYIGMPSVKENELKETAVEFEVEIDAYQLYLNDLKEGLSTDEIYMNVLSILNSETDLLEKKLHELMMESLSSRLSEEDAIRMGTDKWSLLDNFANQVKLIATYDDISDAVDVAYDEFNNYSQKHLVTQESIKREFLRFAPLAEEEIKAYKMALAMNAENAEFQMILAMTKQSLNL